MNRLIPHGVRRDLLILLFFTILSLLMTWPLITRLGSVYAGNNEDLWTFQWDNWWTRYALQHGYDILFTPMQFYPIGVSLAAHSLSFYNSFVWIPLAALFGDIAAYNSTILLTFILSGYTMFKLVEYLISSQGSGIRDQAKSPISNPSSLIPSLVAGIVYAFAPYHFSQSLGHVSLASVQWFPLLAWFTLKTARERAWRNAMAVGLLILLITATRLQFLILGGVVFAIFVTVDWIVSHRRWARGAFARLVIGVILGLVLSLPIVLPAAKLYTEAASPDELIADEQTWGQTDLLAYALPMTYHPLLGSSVQPLYENFIKNQAWMPFLGYTTIGLSIWGSVRLKRRSLPWIAIGLFLFVMALGPFLRINGIAYENIRLPYALIGDKFPLNTLRSPDRYNLLLMLALAPLAAFGVDDILRRMQAKAGRQSGASNTDSRPLNSIGILIGGLILFEYLGLPYPTIEPLKTSPFQLRLANDPEPYAVLDIPLRRSDTKYYLYYQTQHEHPIVQGRVARVPPEAYTLFNQIPLLSAWRDYVGAARIPDLGSQLAQLAAHNVRYIILHKDFTAPAIVSSLRNYFTLPPAYEDDQIAVYSTRPSIQPITNIGPLGLVDSWAGVDGPDKPIRVRVRWTTTAPIEQDYRYRLSLIGEDGASLISQTARLEPATSTWLTRTLVIGDYQLTPTSPVPVGRYTLQLTVLDGDKTIGAIDLPHRIINVPVRDSGDWIMVVTDEPHARFGSSIELRAADVSRRGNLLSLWLHWHARDAPKVDTKYFVHLLDIYGNLAAQEDGIHVNSTRPSSEWQADEMISDLIEMPLWNLKPGEYRIAVGLTDPDTTVRLPAFDQSGQTLPENRYVFSETVSISESAMIQRADSPTR